jgi:hypothetical protein
MKLRQLDRALTKAITVCIGSLLILGTAWIIVRPGNAVYYGVLYSIAALAFILTTVRESEHALSDLRVTWRQARYMRTRKQLSPVRAMSAVWLALFWWGSIVAFLAYAATWT